MKPLDPNVFRFAAISRRRRAPRAAAFTLIEVVATLLLISIAMPVIMSGISLSTRAGGIARRRAEAGALAESKLNELVSTGLWQSTLQGDFGTDDPWKDYTWTAELNPWSQSMGVNGSNVVQELDLHVNWKENNAEQHADVSTLVYQSASSQ
ncbi:MAG TPA: type II secretion system protein [Tepidisphaeraceae bacterium]|jgi:type II secretory pathway pseudopilin PulG|nr:type II secretion system protein [Tepidisphaeraceae bacterium]